MRLTVQVPVPHPGPGLALQAGGGEAGVGAHGGAAQSAGAQPLLLTRVLYLHQYILKFINRELHSNTVLYPFHVTRNKTRVTVEWHYIYVTINSDNYL